MKEEKKEIAIVEGSVSSVDIVLNEAVQDSFDPQPIKVEIVHATGELSIEGLPSFKSRKFLVLASKKARVFFPKFSNRAVNDDILVFTDNRPFCSSANAVMGKLTEADWDNIVSNSKDAIVMVKEKISQGGLICKRCPLSAFGSVVLFGNQGKGQACNELRRLLLWSPGLVIPMILTLPPTSIRRWDAYCSTLQASNTQFNRVLTEISLEKISVSGNNYSVAKFAYAGNISEDVIVELSSPVVHDGVEKTLVKMLIDIFIGNDVEITDYINGSVSKEEEEF